MRSQKCMSASTKTVTTTISSKAACPRREQRLRMSHAAIGSLSTDLLREKTQLQPRQEPEVASSKIIKNTTTWHTPRHTLKQHATHSIPTSLGLRHTRLTRVTSSVLAMVALSHQGIEDTRLMRILKSSLNSFMVNQTLLKSQAHSE